MRMEFIVGGIVSKMELLISGVVSRMELPKMFQVTIPLVVNYQNFFRQSEGWGGASIPLVVNY